MEIESKRDQVQVTLPRAEAEALWQAADDGIRIINTLGLVRVISTTERAHHIVAAAIAKRGASITLTFDRVGAAAYEKAARTGQHVIAQFEIAREHGAAGRAIEKLSAASR